MKTPTYKLLAVFLLFLSTINAQQKIEINLANNAGNIRTESVQPGVPLKIIIVNRSLAVNYKIKVIKRTDLLEELTLEKETGIVPFTQVGCNYIREQINLLYEFEDEKKLGLAIKELEKKIDEIESSDDKLTDDQKKCNKQQIFEARYSIESTKESLLSQTLKNGEILEVVISRKKEGEENAIVEWRRVFKTENKGKWLTTYGFTYINQTFKKAEPYFLKQMDSTFSVNPLNRRSKLSFVPSVFFTWLPYSHTNQDFSLSLTGGLGYDLEAPTAFLGANLLYNQNIGISLGIAAHQQDFLNGQYNAGDILNENLSKEQLNEKLYVFNPFISINFRFGAPPLKNGDSDAE